MYYIIYIKIPIFIYKIIITLVIRSKDSEINFSLGILRYYISYYKLIYWAWLSEQSSWQHRIIFRQYSFIFPHQNLNNIINIFKKTRYIQNKQIKKLSSETSTPKTPNPPKQHNSGSGTKRVIDIQATGTTAILCKRINSGDALKVALQEIRCGYVTMVPTFWQDNPPHIFVLQPGNDPNIADVHTPFSGRKFFCGFFNESRQFFNLFGVIMNLTGSFGDFACFFFGGGGE